MKALICGAGIAGLALAGRLNHHGWDVTLVERAPGPRRHGYMIDFSGPGFDAVTAMGLEPQLRRLASPVREFRYIDDRGRTTVSLDYEIFVKALEGQIVSIMRPALEELLREALGAGVDLRYGLSVEQIIDDAAVLSDGTVIEVDLIVGADGIHSRIRSQVFGPESDYLRDLGMHTSAFVVEDQEVFEQVRGQFVLTESLDRQLGLYGLGEGRVAAFTVHRTDAERAPDDAREEVRGEFAGLGELADRVLSRCPPSREMYYDQVAQILMPRWTDSRVALVGDAAYAVSLVAGQGASLGIAGAHLLTEMLATGALVPEALAEYERRWRPVATGIQDAARDRVIEVFLPRSTRTLLLRRWGFRAMKLPGLHRVMTGSLFPKGSRSITELSDLGRAQLRST
ncbi:FAD-dependent monooxygenase [Brachybacterium fresconis]|uniref:2-polyprenyl-6-methoxyphenol hydroxylase-like FAD-dependent oxidoreductase n=1 Tax=Brachybacterium fresconis TaxID=173363 RepID=A0ABS4YJT2_9MICO|nr:FAD-dependent monooxygenase [Brachybacterium fresconis]MBP2409060.1 2-polyprenyl-6-methoxyphenol hydroxylase-like FAD-dependent oxidoreductase [Brachybacterium fresconis]